MKEVIEGWVFNNSEWETGSCYQIKYLLVQKILTEIYWGLLWLEIRYISKVKLLINKNILLLVTSGLLPSWLLFVPDNLL